MTRPVLVLLALPACGTPELGARDVASVGLLLQAVEAASLVAEIARHGVLPEPDEPPACPAVSRVSGYVTLDYGGGCSPDTGWVLGELTGTTRLDLGEDVTADLDGLTAGGIALDGEVTARRTPVSDVAIDLGLDLADPDAFELTLTIGLGQAPPLRIDGTAQRNAGGVGNPMTLTDLVVPAPTDGCFAPTSGTATVESGFYGLSLTFAADGTTAVVRDDGAEGTIDTCEGAAALFGG
jgi:hypothetical protein